MIKNSCHFLLQSDQNQSIRTKKYGIKHFPEGYRILRLLWKEKNILFKIMKYAFDLSGQTYREGRPPPWGNLFQCLATLSE